MSARGRELSLSLAGDDVAVLLGPEEVLSLGVLVLTAGSVVDRRREANELISVNGHERRLGARVLVREIGGVVLDLLKRLRRVVPVDLLEREAAARREGKGCQSLGCWKGRWCGDKTQPGRRKERSPAD